MNGQAIFFEEQATGKVKRCFSTSDRLVRAIENVVWLAGRAGGSPPPPALRGNALQESETDLFSDFHGPERVAPMSPEA